MWNLKALPSMRALRAFEASARHLNFRLAAEALSVTPAAVAQHVRQLEDELGLALFERHARGLALTEAGRAYHGHIRQALETIAQATMALGARARGVTLSVTPTFAAKWLLPRLPDFAQAYPDIDLRVQATDRLAGFSSDGVDIAVRLGGPPFEGRLCARKLLDCELVAVGSPAAPGLAAMGAQGLSAQELFAQVLLSDAHDNWPAFCRAAFGREPPASVRRLSFNQTSLAIDAALSGQGVALAARCFVERDLAAGRLSQVVAPAWHGGKDFHVVYTRHAGQRTVVRAVRCWLLEQAGVDDAGEAYSSTT